LPGITSRPGIDVSIVIVSYNVREMLRSCLASVYRMETRRGYDVWVVDNASHDGSPEMVRAEFPEARLIANSENLGFAAANNQALERSTGTFALLLNCDAEIIGGSLDRLVDVMEAEPKTGLLGCKLVYADGSFQHSCFRFPGFGQLLLDLYPLHPRLSGTRLNGRYPRSAYRHPFDADACLGACLLWRRATGLVFDPGYFMYVEEIDLCWRMKAAGWRVRYSPELTVLHHAGGSTRQTPSRSRRMLWESRRRFNRKHRGPLFRAGWELLARAGGVPPPDRATQVRP